ncbi:di-trans,poly-cis-decaprenylcistransferase [Streptomyces sp. ISL-98]|uniref:polyprenyl diphosphate synthase n=1 Tax=Streptomyces sp. ISL-98 TaxID=2819192 RepID=UPI001BE60CA7|nr:polyprenyl diphosphate synthase [Streptomyces sp. ISL-98]MBT2509249.1 di-trans,poly-cis-decaprenylcistransferase [Streptomyces sp. ISL-98]
MPSDLDALLQAGRAAAHWTAARLNELTASLDASQDPAPRLVPRHVAVILDGNGRWAREQGLPRIAGHEAGLCSLLDTVDAAQQAGVEYLSAYCFSTENWRRPGPEVAYLLGMLQRTCDQVLDGPDRRQVRIRWAGRADLVPDTLACSIRAVERATAHHTALTLILCVNYGGHAEITDGVRRLVASVKDEHVACAGVDEQQVRDNLYLPDVPDVDLIIRTSGEQRISNFLPWQLAYAEMVFDPVPWPQFGGAGFRRALDSFTGRNRRLGTHPIDSPEVPTADLARYASRQEAQDTGAQDAADIAARLSAGDVQGTLTALNAIVGSVHDTDYATALHRALRSDRLHALWLLLGTWDSCHPGQDLGEQLWRALRLSLEIASHHLPITTWWNAPPSTPARLSYLLAGAHVAPGWREALPDPGQTDDFGSIPNGPRPRSNADARSFDPDVFLKHTASGPARQVAPTGEDEGR